jgi:hypothetical protein
MTYDRTGHPLARPAGMVGCMSFGVNNPIGDQRRDPKREDSLGIKCGDKPSSRAKLDRFLSPAIGEAGPRESDRAIIPVRLRIYEAACDISAGESRD